MNADSFVAKARLSFRSLAGLLLAVAVLLSVTLVASPTVRADPDDFEEGDIFAAVGNGLIKRFDADGTLIETLETTSDSEFTTGMCWDTTNHLYTTNFSDGTMSKFDVTGTLVEYPWGGPFDIYPTDCVQDLMGNIYVSDGNDLVRQSADDRGGNSGHIYHFDTSGTLLETFTPETDGDGISGLALAADACTMYYTAREGVIYRFDVCTGTQLADFATGVSPYSCYQLGLRADGEVVVACGDTVHRVDASGNVVHTYTELPTGLYYALTLDPSDDSFWVGERFSGEVYQVDIESADIMQQFNAGVVGPQMNGLSIYVPQETTAITLDSFQANNGVNGSHLFVTLALAGLFTTLAAMYHHKRTSLSR